MAFKSTLTNSQNSWKASNDYNTPYREKEDIRVLNNKVTMSQTASLATRVHAMRLELKDNFDKNINTSISKDENEKINSSIKEKIYSPISLETELLQYKKHERDDSSSDSSLQIHSSDNSVSATSTRLTTPVDNLDSKFDYMRTGLSPPNTGTKNSFSDFQKNDEIQVLTIKLEKQQQQHKEELEKLRKEHKTQSNKSKLDYEKSKNDQKQEFERIIQELKSGNKLEMDKLRKELMNRNKNDNDDSQKKELTREKNRIMEEWKKMKMLKEKVEAEKRSIKQKYEERIKKLCSEHAEQLDSMKGKETKVTFMQIQRQRERDERELRNQIEELTRELNEKEVSEKQKEAQIAELQEECTRSLQDLNRNKNMIKEFTQKVEERMREQLNDKKKVERESEQIIEKLREQLSNTELNFNEVKEHCEDLESLIKDKSDIINRLQLQLERRNAESEEELNTQNFKESKERQERAIASLREKLEASHQKDLQELRVRLEKEYETKIIGHNSILEQNSVQNFETVKELKEATRRLANAESSYTELNSKHQQVVHEKQQLLNEMASIRSKVENLEVNNFDLKENDRLVTSEKERVAEVLKKTKDEIRRLRDESSTASDKIIELENERDKLTSTISTVKAYWEKNYKDLQIQFQETESQRDKLDDELTKIKTNHNEKIKSFEELTMNVETIEKQKESLSKLVEEHQSCMKTFMNENAAEREAWSQKEADLVSNYELELREKDSELEELRGKLDHTRKRSEELEELLLGAQEAETKQLELSQKLEAALQECANKDNEISNLEMFKKQSQARIDSLESSTNRLTVKLRGFETDAEQAKRNADVKISDLQNRLKNSMAEIEDLHNQVSDLKQKLIEKEAMVLSHSRSSSRDGPRSPIFDTSKLTNLAIQVEEYKVANKKLEAQIATFTQKLQETYQEKNTIMATFEQSIAQAEKTTDELRNKIKTMTIEHEEETKQIFNNNQLSIQELKKQQEDEIAKITEFAKSKLAALERRQLNITNSADRSSSMLEQRLLELENLLRDSRSECNELNEKIMHVQQNYADSMSEKDKIAKERNDMGKRLKSLEEELQVVLAKNMELVMSMSNYNL